MVTEILRCKRLLMTGFHWDPDEAVPAVLILLGIVLEYFPDTEEEECQSRFTLSQKTQIVLFQFKEVAVTNILGAVQGLKRTVKLLYSNISLSLKQFCRGPYHLCICFPHF